MEPMNEMTLVYVGNSWKKHFINILINSWIYRKIKDCMFYSIFWDESREKFDPKKKDEVIQHLLGKLKIWPWRLI